MTLAVGVALDRIRRSLGGRPAGLVSELDIVNRAGDYLYTMRPWHFLVSTAGTGDVVSGQDYVTIASDVGELIYGGAENALTSYWQPVTLEALVDARNSSLPVVTGYLYALESGANATTGQLEPRLAIYPTPTAADAGAMRFPYRRKWVVLTSDNGTINLPALGTVRTLFLELCAIFARGYEREIEGSLIGRLEGIRQTEFFRAAVREDAAQVRPVSGLRGGWLRQRGLYNTRYVTGTLSPPEVG